MNAWILSLIGVVFLGVMIEIISPNGKTNNFIKSVFGLFVIITLIAPIKSLINFNYDADFNNQINFTNSNLTLYINEKSIEMLENDVKSQLENNDIMGVIVKICGNLFEENFVIDYVYVDLNQLVLTDDITNINKYEKIENIIIKVLKIKKECILFNE